jgi:predicted acyl esterase
MWLTRDRDAAPAAAGPLMSVSSESLAAGAMSEVRDGICVEWDVPIRMDDGLDLRADVFRPAAAGRYAVLMGCGPYAKGLHFEDGRPGPWQALCRKHPDVLAGSSHRYACWEHIDPEKWVPHGYVCVRVDSRGTGRSPGYVDHWSPRETKDLYDCIEWAGTRAWSNGKVGLTGISYLAMNQWQVAAMQPPHLAAICPWEGLSDHYRDCRRHGGILSTFMMHWFQARIPIAQYGVGERGERNRITGRPVCGDETMTEEALVRNRVDLVREMREHTLLDDYFAQLNPDLSRIVVPLLSAGNWGGQGMHLRGNCEGFVHASSRQKWLELHDLEHWTHFYTDYGRELQKRFFDHFLRGIDNGWDKLPPVMLNIRKVDGTTTPRYEDAWPIPRTRWTRFYLDPATHSLSRTPLPSSRTLEYAALEKGATFRIVLDEETEITGPSAAKLFVASSTTDADLFLTLRVFDPEGREVTFQGANDAHTPVAQGWLRASHRKLDPVRTKEYQPYHTHDDPQPLRPGSVYELDIEIWPTSVVIPKGYTLALTVEGKDYVHDPARSPTKSWFSSTSQHDDPGDRPADVFGGTVTLYGGGQHSAYVLVPVIPAGKA